MSPTRNGTIYIGSQYLFRSRNFGQTWDRISPDLSTNDPNKQRQEEYGGGTQMINVKFGGTLYQDLKSDYTDLQHDHRQSGTRSETTHGITVTDPDSHLARLLRTSSCRVNSLHHQAIKRLGRGLKVTARSEDGLVEAVEASGYPFLIAVQWHPEEIADRPEEFRIFEQFAAKCREHAERREQPRSVAQP